MTETRIFLWFISLCCPAGGHQHLGGRSYVCPQGKSHYAVQFWQCFPSVRPSRSLSFKTVYRIWMKWWVNCVLICIDRTHVALWHSWRIRRQTNSSKWLAKCLEWYSSLTSKQQTELNWASNLTNEGRNQRTSEPTNQPMEQTKLTTEGWATDHPTKWLSDWLAS
jgi:hypothetical protein